MSIASICQFKCSLGKGFCSSAWLIPEIRGALTPVIRPIRPVPAVDSALWGMSPSLPPHRKSSNHNRLVKRDQTTGKSNMASVFKRNNAGNYYAEWFDHEGKRRSHSQRISTGTCSRTSKQSWSTESADCSMLWIGPSCRTTYSMVYSSRGTIQCEKVRRRATKATLPG